MQKAQRRTLCSSMGIEAVLFYSVFALSRTTPPSYWEKRHFLIYRELIPTVISELK